MAHSISFRRLPAARAAFPRHKETHMAFARSRLIATASVLALACASILTTASPAAAAPSRATARVLANTIVPAVASHHAARTGLVPLNSVIHFAIALQPRNEAAENAFVQSLGERNSTNYHHFLTPAQVNARFGPTAASQAA